MSLLLKNKKFQILLSSLALTLLIFFLSKNSNLSSYSARKLPFNLRFLLEAEDVDKRCKNTPKNFLEKYKDLEISNKQFLEEDKLEDRYQQALRDMIKDKKVNKIKEYLPKIILYIIMLVVDIILLIIWFVFCGCFCCGKKNKDAANCCSKCYFVLFFLFSIIAILVCVYGFFIIPKFYKSVNGVICSLYKLVFHFTEGTKDDFPENNWKGFEGINNLIEEYYDTNEKINSLKNCSNKDIYSSSYNKFVGKLKNENKNQNDNFTLNLESAGNIINLTSEAINNLKNKTLDDVEEVMELFDKYCKLGLYVLLSAISVFCFLGLLTLTPYFVCDCKCISCLYHIIWNIEMLIILVTMLAGIGLGIFGKVSKDAVEVLKFAKSEENLFSEDPFLLKFNEEYKNITNICFNGDGDLFPLVFESHEVYISNINSYSNDFDSLYSKLKEENKDSDDEIVQKYEEMNEIINSLKELNEDLNTNNLSKIFNCSFFERDSEILLIELKDTMANELCLFSLIIIVADLVAFLSILFGVVFASNYSGQRPAELPSQDRHIKMSSKYNRQNMDSSSDNLRK